MVALAASREAAGLTQRELSAKLKRSKGFVFNVESGVRRIEVCDFFDWAKECGVDPMRILKDVYPQKSPHRSSRRPPVTR